MSDLHHGWLTRRRLLDAVDGARVVILDAPGGWGKTTFAEQLIDSGGSAAVRVTLVEATTPAAVASAIRRGLRRAGLGELAAALVGDDRKICSTRCSAAWLPAPPGCC